MSIRVKPQSIILGKTESIIGRFQKELEHSIIGKKKRHNLHRPTSSPLDTLGNLFYMHVHYNYMHVHCRCFLWGAPIF